MRSRETEELLLFTVDDKSRASLVPRIIHHSEIDAVLLSDKTSSLVNARRNESVLDNIGYTHLWVNHSQEWVHSHLPDVHTQNIENTWRRLKSSISHVKRHLSKEILDDYISVFMMRYNLNENDFFYAFIEIMKTVLS